MPDLILETKALSYTYPDGTCALNNVCLQVKRGEKLAVMGGNGSGKSTLFLNLNGVYKPSSGTVLLNGSPISYSRKGLLELRRRVGIVFQDPDNQLFCASVVGEISFGLFNLGLNESIVRQRVGSVMEKLHITPFSEKPTHFLSGGQKKRVSIADILVMEPELLILDEPYTALDPLHASTITELLNELSATGITVILATHDANRAFAWADSVVLLNQGEILAKGNPKEIFSDSALLTKANLESPTVLQLFNLLCRQGILPQEPVPRTIAALENALQGSPQL